MFNLGARSRWRQSSPLPGTTSGQTASNATVPCVQDATFRLNRKTPGEKVAAIFITLDEKWE